MTQYNWVKMQKNRNKTKNENNARRKASHEKQRTESTRQNPAKRVSVEGRPPKERKATVSPEWQPRGSWKAIVETWTVL